MSEQRRRRLLVAGWILAAVALLVGAAIGGVLIVIGMVFAVRRRHRVAIVLVAIGTVLAVTLPIVFTTVFDGHGFRIPSGSMEPALQIGDRIYGLYDQTPERGEIFVYRRPAGSETFSGERCGRPRTPKQACDRPTPDQAAGTFVGRVVAVPGDRLKIVGNRVHLNGRRADEPSVKTQPCTDVCNFPKEITVPPDHYFMMGDNRGESDDSREWGPVPADWLIARAVFRYWPLDRLGSP